MSFERANEDKDSKNGCFECLACSDYHLPVNRVHWHHFQNEFYWLDVARYFVNPYSCSSRVHRSLDFFFFFLSLPQLGENWALRRWSKPVLYLGQNKCFSCIDEPCSEGGRKAWKWENLSSLEWRIRHCLPQQLSCPILSPINSIPRLYSSKHDSWRFQIWPVSLISLSLSLSLSFK